MADFSQYKIKKPSGAFDQYKAKGAPDQEMEDPGAFLDSMPEPESWWSKLPRDVLIGLTHAGRNVHNLPHDLVRGIESGAEGIGDAFNLPYSMHGQGKRISDYLPNDESNYADVFGQQGEGTLMDNLIQGGIEHAPELIGLRGLARAGLRKLPITKKAASRQLREAERLAGETEDLNAGISPGSVGEALGYLPKTRATSEMLSGVGLGEYKPSFGLQSQLGHHERALRKSPLASERLQAPEVRELKNKILSEMDESLRKGGHHEVADLMKGGMNDYRKYMKFKEKAFPILKKLGFPVTGLALLGIGTKTGKKFLSNFFD